MVDDDLQPPRVGAKIALAIVGLQIPRIPFKPWMHWGLSALFLLFHNIHAGIVYARCV